MDLPHKISIRGKQLLYSLVGEVLVSIKGELVRLNCAGKVRVGPKRGVIQAFSEYRLDEDRFFLNDYRLEIKGFFINESVSQVTESHSFCPIGAMTLLPALMKQDPAVKEFRVFSGNKFREAKLEQESETTALLHLKKKAVARITPTSSGSEVLVFMPKIKLALTETF